MSIVVVSFLILSIPQDADAAIADRVSGKILLDVQNKGEAYYVNPLNKQRYFLGRPDTAFSLMRELGLGITNQNLAKIPVGVLPTTLADSDGDELADVLEEALQTDSFHRDTDRDGYDDKTEIVHGYDPRKGSGQKMAYDPSMAQRLAGRILLQVEDRGQGWYVNPSDNKRYYLGNPNSAFAVMKHLGLGITHKDLQQIPLHQKYQEPIQGGTQTQEQDMSSLKLVHTSIPLFSENVSVDTKRITFDFNQRVDTVLSLNEAELIGRSRSTPDMQNFLKINSYFENEGKRVVVDIIDTLEPQYEYIFSVGDFLPLILLFTTQPDTTKPKPLIVFAKKTEVDISFSEAIIFISITLTGGVSVVDASNNEIHGTFESQRGDGTFRVRFIPDTPLEYGVPYRVLITEDLMDLAGNRADRIYSESFVVHEIGLRTEVHF